MHRRLQKKEQLDEAQCSSLPSPSQDEEFELRETFWCDVRLSTNPKEECRFILLGGDELAKNDACRFILRTAQAQQVQGSNLGRCEKKENYVQGRHVCVVNSPFLWMDRLASPFSFSKILKSIQNEMQNCISLVFPGPHAFLVVIKVGTGKEHYLLKAITSVFGKEAIDYSMVVFIAGSELSKNATLKSLSMCKDRYHLLENTDESVQELFRKVEEMISNKKSKFFIPSAYEIFTQVNFESWEKDRIALLDEYKNKEEKLCKKLKDLDITTQNLRKEIENISQLMESTQLTLKTQLRQLQNASQQRESELRTELDASQQRESELQTELDASQQRESELQTELDASQQRESELRTELDASQQRESELQTELDASQQRESELQTELDASQQRESELRMELDASQQRESELQTELDASQQRESELQTELDASQQREREKMMHLDASHQRESELRKELEAFQCRESELRKEHRWREVESKQQEPQATGTQLVRWGSKDQLYPVFSSDQADYLEPV
ncbi:coiled-coil domain-containing protein 186-like isoform X2 [Pangasianodon hypophthalmus]|uniref:coiled-coil domain-containing protein 186-like isoform X2 n=1 Tax=Pangasianodon hypophthalmus TaxID=310915 RepID=UPI0023073D43|nr:coiled-coil domain-containing protein 186-like isoform X2 [Pangasianodon hypophthalmus]